MSTVVINSSPTLVVKAEIEIEEAEPLKESLESPVKPTTRTADDEPQLTKTLEDERDSAEHAINPESDSEDSPLQRTDDGSKHKTSPGSGAAPSSSFTSPCSAIRITPSCRRHCFYWTLSCCCPCLLQGNITSKLERESPFTCFRYSCCASTLGSDIEFGSVGCKACCYSACMASCIWPCSLPLSVHNLWQRYKFKLFYPEDYRLRSTSSYSSCCYYLVNWPENLLEQHQFVKDLYSEGQLTFKWDFDSYQDQLLPRPSEKTFIMMLFSAHTPAKMEFLRKYMMAVDRYSAFDHPSEESNAKANQTINGQGPKSSLSPRGSKEGGGEGGKVSPRPGIEKLHNKDADSALLFSLGNKADAEQASTGGNGDHINGSGVGHNDQSKEVSKRNPLEGVDQIHSWIRNLSMRNSDHVAFLEVWDVPTFKFNVYIVRNHTMHSDIALYVFDPSMSNEEIDLIKQKYQDNISMFAEQHEKELMKLLNDDGDDDDDGQADGGKGDKDGVEKDDDETSKKTASYLLVLTTNNLTFRRRGLNEDTYQQRVSDIVSWVKKQGSPWDQIMIEEEKDFQRFNKEINRILRS